MTEPFNYTAGSGLNGQSGGTGWNGAWHEDDFANGAVPESIQAGNLSFSNLITSGNHLRTAGQFSYDDRLSIGTFGASVPSQAWISFLIRRDAAGPVPGSDYGGLVLGDEHYPNSLFIGKPSGGDTTHYALENGDGSNQHPTTVSEQPGVTAFLVVHLVLITGNEAVDLYVNPTPGSTPPLSPNASKNDLDLTQFSQFSISTGTSANWSFDEIRVGSTFGDVAPATPEPAGIVLLAGLIPLFRRPLRRHHRRA
ncbi:MAG TPA: hypothetical protein VL282_17555 [Tepidisphaeraceae bacterium]|nr:hypothetical protein [Tepidisphaeraceae bacterium]